MKTFSWQPHFIQSLWAPSIYLLSSLFLALEALEELSHTSFSQEHIFFPAVGNTDWALLACTTLSLHQFLGQLWGQILKKWPSKRCLAALFSIILIPCCACWSCFITSAVLHLLQFPLRSPLHIIFLLLASNFISALCFQSVFNYLSFS